MIALCLPASLKTLQHRKNGAIDRAAEVQWLAQSICKDRTSKQIHNLFEIPADYRHVTPGQH
jgi:hypothetical protein